MTGAMRSSSAPRTNGHRAATKHQRCADLFCQLAGSGDVLHDGVRGVSIKGLAGAVIAQGGAGVGVSGELLHVSQRPSVERGGDGGVA